MSECSVTWSEKSEKLKSRLIEEKGVDGRYIWVITLSLDEVFNLQKQGYETLSDWFGTFLFNGKPAPYGAYSVHHLIVDAHHSHRVEVIIWAEDDEV